jgi:HEAT repeat protein
MTEIARSQQVFDQIEFFLKKAKYEYAEALLFQLLDQDPSDRKSRLYALLVNVTREGPVLYEEDIDQLRNLSNLNDSEKEFVRRLFVLGFKSARKEGREDQIRAYQQLLTRLQLNQPLEPSILVHEERLRAYVSHYLRGLLCDQ